VKSMEEYISDVYKRYEESERNHEVYKKVRMTRKRPLTTLCSVTACLLVACVCFFGYDKFNTPPVIKENPVFVEKIEDELCTYTQYIKVNGGIFKKQLDFLVNTSEIIAIIDDFNKVDVISKMKNEKVFINTNATIKIKSLLKGAELVNNNQIRYTYIGGKILFSELQTDTSYNWDEWEKLNIGYNIPVEEKEKTYYEMIIDNAEVLEKGKEYLVFLKKDNNNNEEYILTDNLYGIMEYDPVTNKVKNIDTGEFEEFDWDLLIDK